MGDKFSKFRGGGGRDDCDCEDDDCNGENGSDDDLFDSEDLENPTLPDGFERPDLFVIPMPDPSQIREILAKGAPTRIVGDVPDSDETKSAKTSHKTNLSISAEEALAFAKNLYVASKRCQVAMSNVSKLAETVNDFGGDDADVANVDTQLVAKGEEKPSLLKRLFAKKVKRVLSKALNDEEKVLELKQAVVALKEKTPDLTLSSTQMMEIMDMFVGNLPEEMVSEFTALTDFDDVAVQAIVSLDHADPTKAAQMFSDAAGKSFKVGKAAPTKTTIDRDSPLAPKPWDEDWEGTVEQWTTEMEAILKGVVEARQIFDKHFDMLDYDESDVIARTEPFVNPEDLPGSHALPSLCFFGDIDESEQNMLLQGGNPLIERHREFDSEVMVGDGPVPTVFPHKMGSKYTKDNFAIVIKPYYDTEEVVVLENYIIVRTCNLDGPGRPTNQYTVLSYDTFRLDVYGCEALGAPGGTQKKGCTGTMCAKCSYKGQCCKYNPLVDRGDTETPDKHCTLHNWWCCEQVPSSLNCCHQFCCGCFDNLPADPDGPNKIVFRQYPDAHTKANRHTYCFCKKGSSFDETAHGNLVCTVSGLDAQSAKDAVVKIHAAQKAWLKKMDYAIPAAKSFTRFQASSTCGTLLVLDAQDPCFTVFGGSTNVVWAGAKMAERVVDYVNWEAANPGARAIEMKRNDCFTCKPTVMRPSKSIKAKDAFRFQPRKKTRIPDCAAAPKVVKGGKYQFDSHGSTNHFANAAAAGFNAHGPRASSAPPAGGAGYQPPMRTAQTPLLQSAYPSAADQPAASGSSAASASDYAQFMAWQQAAAESKKN